MFRPLSVFLTRTGIGLFPRRMEFQIGSSIFDSRSLIDHLTGLSFVGPLAIGRDLRRRCGVGRFRVSSGSHLACRRSSIRVIRIGISKVGFHRVRELGLE